MSSLSFIAGHTKRMSTVRNSRSRSAVTRGFACFVGGACGRQMGVPGGGDVSMAVNEWFVRSRPEAQPGAAGKQFDAGC